MKAITAAWIVLGTVGIRAEQVTFRLVEREVIERRLQQVTPKNNQRFQAIKQLFSDSGCEVEEQPVRGSKLPNLICRLAGSGASTLIVGAHYDCTGGGAGAIDNWSGASLLPTLFESLRATPRTHTYLFVAFAAEESGLIGSRRFVSNLSKEERQKVAAVLNLDSIGTGPTEVEQVGADKELLQKFLAVALQQKLPISIMDANKVGMSDANPFQDAKIPALSVHSLTNETFRLLHSPKDQLEHIKRDDYFQTYRLLTTFLAYLDTIP